MTRPREWTADARARARDLHWLARRAVRGDPFGRHPGRDVGPGIEFSQYRPYEPGDDARWLDWQRLARGQDPLIRLAPREARVTVSVVLDTSGSMAEPASVATPDWTRMDCARALAATVLAIARRQGDAFHWLRLDAVTAGAALSGHATPGHSDAHLATCVAALSDLVPAREWPPVHTLRDALQRLPKAGLVLMISDFIADSPATDALAGVLSAGRRDVIALQILTRDEVDFGYRGNVEFVDRETGERRRAHSDAARAAYLENLARARRQLRRAFLRRGAAFESVLAEQSPDDILRPVLHAYQRARAARGLE
ncbi:MAG: DUF58 domain-containing protein [Pseudomonadota bacterium]